MTRSSGLRTDGCGDPSVLDKYRVSLSPSLVPSSQYHHNWMISRHQIPSHNANRPIFSLGEIVSPFCSMNVLHKCYWHAEHSQTDHLFRVNPVSDSEQDMRYSDQDVVTLRPSLPRKTRRKTPPFPPGPTRHGVITRCQNGPRHCQVFRR